MTTAAEDPAAWIDMQPAEFSALRDRIRAHCGLAFGEAKRSLLATRLQPRLAALGLDSFTEYDRLLARC